MNSFRKIVTAISGLILPSSVSFFVLNLLGHKMEKGAKIGFSWIYVDQLVISGSATVGHLNFISTRRLVMREYARIGRANIVNGPLSLHLAATAALGNANKVTRGAYGVVYGPATLKIGKLAKITANHRIDCTCSVVFGDYSILAGSASQVWTHGYVHDLDGPGRYRVDGPCFIGDNVYIGSRALISMGVSIGSGCIVGAGAVVSKDLDGNAMYVSSVLRKLPRPAAPESRTELEKVPSSIVIESVFEKKNKSD